MSESGFDSRVESAAGLMESVVGRVILSERLLRDDVESSARRRRRRRLSRSLAEGLLSTAVAESFSGCVGVMESLLALDVDGGVSPENDIVCAKPNIDCAKSTAISAVMTYFILKFFKNSIFLCTFADASAKPAKRPLGAPVCVIFSA